MTLQLRDLVVEPTLSLRDAMKRMTLNKKGIVFVCDQARHLAGVLSDGDVRRAILTGAVMTGPTRNVMNLDPVVALDCEEGKELLEERGLAAVPVVDEVGNVKEAVFRTEGGVRVLVWEASVTGEASGARDSANAIAIIPARGGSQRFPRKNLAKLRGMPLVGHAILASLGAHEVGRVILSTDDDEIAGVARSMGVDVPWLRPVELSGDGTPTIEVVLHALQWVASSVESLPEYGVLIEPTAPLRRPGHIDEAVCLLQRGDADSVVGVSEVPHIFNPEEVLEVVEGEIRPSLGGRTMDGRKLRQEQEPVYYVNGIVYAFRPARVLESKSLYGEVCIPLIIETAFAVDIDEPEDLGLAETRWERLQANSLAY